MLKLASLLPALIVAGLTLLAAAPWGLEGGARFIMPLLPFLAIGQFALRGRDVVQPGLVFASGLTLDVLTHGPLGFWSLVFLAGFLLAQSFTGPRWATRIGRWLAFAGAMAGVVLVQWLVTSLYFMELAELRPLLIAGLVVIAVQPLVMLVLEPVERFGAPARRLNLERGE